MNAWFKLFVGVFFATSPLFAQAFTSKHSITLGFGPSIPGEDLARPFKGSPSLSVAYGYMYRPHFQIDLGVDTVVGAADVQDATFTAYGPMQIRDYQFLLPIGVRGVLPLGRDRVRLGAGAGGAYLHYTELLDQPDENTNVPCAVCTSRNGWAYYGLGALDYFMDEGRHFRVGATAKFYRGRTTGHAFGGVPSSKTNDRWLVFSLHFGLSF